VILIVDMNQRKGSLGLEEFVMPIASIAGECETLHYSEVDYVNNFSKIILSGTPLKDNEYLNRLDSFRWVKECGKPILGICAGMQAIAAVHDSKIVECKEIGMTQIETTGENPLASGIFKAYELHNLAVEPSNAFEVLAKSKNCIQAIKHLRKPLYGVLFHPEVRNPGILERFLKL